ncbi:hypothetical protein ACFQMM_11575 [Saliphagus sp. GCM10025308]
MIGAYTIGKKALKFGYKRYGIPGAVASGGVALAGYVVVRRALKSSTDSNNVTSAIDAQEIKRTVDEKGIDAVKDRGTLDDAINEDALDTPVDMDEVQSSAAAESDKVTESQDETDDGE